MLENVQFWEEVRRTSFSPQSSTPEKFPKVNHSYSLCLQPEVTHEILLLNSHFAECPLISFCSHAREQADSQSAELQREGASFAVLSPVRLFWKRQCLLHPFSLGYCSSLEILTDGRAAPVTVWLCHYWCFTVVTGLSCKSVVKL